MVRLPNNPLGINQHVGDRKPIALRLPVGLLEEIDNECGVMGGTRTQFIEEACRAALHPEKLVQQVKARQAEPAPIAISPELLKEAVTTLLSLKEAALAREQKLKKPDQELIRQWQAKIDELDGFLATLDD